MIPEDSPAEWVWLARIRRPQGRRGEVFAEILTDFPEKFGDRGQVWLLAPDSLAASARAAKLIAHWLHKGGVVLHLAGVDSISAAKALSGMIIAIPRTQRVALAEDEAYISDLIGCTLVDLAGPQPAAVGIIEDVDRDAGPVALLIVRGAAGEVLIPFAKSYLKKIDWEARRVEMALPEGLIGLNALEKS